MLEIKVTSQEIEGTDELDCNSDSSVEGTPNDISTELTAGLIVLFDNLQEVMDKELAYNVVKVGCIEAIQYIQENIEYDMEEK